MANFIRMTDLDLKGKRVFIRADLNVPTDDNGEITDETRITASLESMRTADTIINAEKVLVVPWGATVRRGVA